MIWTGFGIGSKANAQSIIRRVRTGDAKGARKKIYLTFDDGPDEKGTPAVLEVLARHQAKATFFVIAKEAIIAKNVLDQTIRDGHAIGNHSLDHRYGLFFAKANRLNQWITQAEDQLKQAGVTESVGFRPPAGICTPPLFKTLHSRNEPLILWSHRFFDTALTWTEKRMREVLPQLRDGDIILLHDRQSVKRLDDFIATLDLFISETSRLGFQCDRLTRELCLAQSRVQQQNLKGV